MNRVVYAHVIRHKFNKYKKYANLRLTVGADYQLRAKQLEEGSIFIFFSVSLLFFITIL